MASGTAYAATDGTIGTTSTGTATLTLTIPKLIVIKGLADLSFGPYTGTGVLEANEDIVVNVNMRGSGNQKYKVTGTGSCTGNSPANAFNVSDGTNLVDYHTYFNGATGTSGEAELTAGTASSTISTATFGLTANTDNANYHVQFTQSSLQAASNGTYTGTLTLLVTPQ